MPQKSVAKETSLVYIKQVKTLELYSVELYSVECNSLVDCILSINVNIILGRGRGRDGNNTKS